MLDNNNSYGNMPIRTKLNMPKDRSLALPTHRHLCTMSMGGDVEEVSPASLNRDLDRGHGCSASGSWGRADWSG